jgi:hypothetical protein
VSEPGGMFVFRGLSDYWCYRICYPDNSALGGFGYATEAEAWRALAAHLAELGQAAPTCPHCGQAIGASPARGGGNARMPAMPDGKPQKGG